MFSATPAANAAAPWRTTWTDYMRLRHERTGPSDGYPTRLPGRRVRAAAKPGRPDQPR
jgi:hypothetical protein